MSTPITKEDHINLIRYYLIDKIQLISVRDSVDENVFNTDFLYYYNRLPEEFDYQYFENTDYKMSYMKSLYTLPELKNLLQSFEIDIEYEYSRYKSNEVRNPLPHIKKNYYGADLNHKF